MLAVTLWSGAGLTAAWSKARAALELIRPHVVQLHGAPSLLKAQAPAVAEQVRAALPGTRIWLAAAGDAGHTAVAAGRMSADELHRRRVGVGATAAACGADTVQLNCEGWWKVANRPPVGFDEAAASRWVRDLRAAHPTLIVEHSAYASPLGHSDYPWRGFLGAGLCSRSWYQIYKVTSVDMARAALGRHVRGVREAVARGVVAPDCVAAPYLQLHAGSDPRAVSWLADQWSDVTLWAAGDRMDDAGVRGARALAEIERRGFVGAGRVQRYQRGAGLVADARVGPLTLSSLGIT